MLLGGQQQQQPERQIVDSDDQTDSGSITCLCVGSLLLVVGLHIPHGLGKLNLQHIISISIIRSVLSSVDVTYLDVALKDRHGI